MSDTHTHKGRTQRQSGCFLWCGGGERKTERERERERETERLTHHSVLCLVDSERDRQRTERERERLTQHSVLGQGAVVDHVLCLVGTQEVERDARFLVDVLIVQHVVSMTETETKPV